MATSVDTLIKNAVARMHDLLDRASNISEEAANDIKSRVDSILADYNPPEFNGSQFDYPEFVKPNRTRFSVDDPDPPPEIPGDGGDLKEPVDTTNAERAVSSVGSSPNISTSGLFSDAPPDYREHNFGGIAPTFREPIGDLGRVSLPDSPEAINTDGLFQFERPRTDIIDFNESSPTLLEPQRSAFTMPDTTVNLDTQGLFNQTAPEVNIEPFSEEAPTFNIERIVNDLANVAKPVLRQFDFPVLADLTLEETPEVSIPEFSTIEEPEGLETPDRYGEMYEQKFALSREQYAGFIDDRVNKLLNQLAPEYQRLAQSLSDKLLDNDEALPDEFETALYNRAVMRAKQELLNAEASILDKHAKRGFVAPPGAVNAAINKARYATAEALTGQATDIYVKRRESEIQHRQFIISQTAGQVDNIRSFVSQQTQIELSFLKTCADITSTVLGFYVQTYEHLAKRADVKIRIMQALSHFYDAKLKAAFASLERHKVYLESERQRAQVDTLKIQSIEARIRAQSQEINAYSAMIDAIAKQGGIEELKLKSYQTKADVYRTTTQAQVASYDIYRAQIEGDKGKLQAELAKLDELDKRLKIVSTKAEIEERQNRAIEASNKTKLDEYNSRIQTYKIRADLQRSAYDVYRSAMAGDSELLKARMANLEVFKAQVDSAKIEADLQRSLDDSIANYNKLLASNFDTEARVYETEIRSKSLAFELYKAALAGDSEKLKGEMAKLEAFKSEVNAAEMNINLNKAANDAVRAFNDAQLQKDKQASMNYGMQLDYAMKLLANHLDTERLNNDIYKTDVSVEQQKFQSGIDLLKIDRTMLLEEFRTQFDGQLKQLEVMLRQLEPLANVVTERVKGASNAATASANSLNTMVSTAIQETN